MGPGPGRRRRALLAVFDTAGARWRTGTDVARAPAAQARATLAGLERLLRHTAVRQRLRADSLRFAGETVVGVHGRTGTMAEMRESLAKRAPGR